MKLSEEVLCIIEHQADKGENVNLMLLVQILKELKDLLKIHQKTGNCSNDCSSSTDNSENKHG